MSAVGTLFKKELTDSLRDRRTLLMMILLPMLLYPGMLTLIGTIMAAGKERLAREELVVAVTSDDAALLLGDTPPAHTTWSRMDRARAEAAMRERTVWAAVDAPPGAWAGLAQGQQATVTVLYTKRFDRSIEAHDRAKRVLQKAGVEVLAARLSRANLPRTFAEPLLTEDLDIDFQKDWGPLIASKMLPLTLVLMLFMGALYPAIDVTAGEKERGTLETLLVAPVRPFDVMAAKYLTVATIASAATLMNLLAMGLTFRFGVQLDAKLAMSLSLSAGQVAVMVACLIPSAFMVSGVALAVASMARSFKEGQSLMTPLTLIGTVPGMLTLMPGIELNAATAAVPLLNVALLVKATILGTAQPLHVAIAVASVALCSVGTLWIAANAFQSEALRFGGTESWRDLFRFRRH
ncbi:MAG: ABC transporter permease [Myxococcaceae bacterium]